MIIIFFFKLNITNSEKVGQAMSKITLLLLLLVNESAGTKKVREVIPLAVLFVLLFFFTAF